MTQSLVGRVILRIAVLAAVVWHFYVAVIGVPEPMQARPIHVAFMVFFGFMMIRWNSTTADHRSRTPWYDWILAFIGIGAALHIFFDYQRVVWRIPLSDPLMPLDWFFGVASVLAILELTRRTAGWTLPILAVSLFAYTLLGRFFPDPLYHPGVKYHDLLDMLFLMPDGLYGSIANLSLTILFMFIAFGAFLETAGGNALLSKIIAAVSRNTKGGPAKAAVISSALFGAVSGSGPANVFATGTITIPLMKKNGFKPEFAAAVEAVASQLGQIIPPVMGTAAFLVAEFSRVSYGYVATAAILPALLYVYATYLITALETEKQGIGVYHDERFDSEATARSVLWQYGHILIPIILLVALMAAEFSTYYAATLATLSAIPISWLRRETRMGLTLLLKGFDDVIERMTALAPVVLCAGIIVATLQLTGVPYALTALIIKASGGYFIAVLLIIAVITIILGMGLPPTGAFLIASVFGASAITQFGVSPFVAYMYIFMWSVLANITPPVCLASFAAASIAECSYSKAGWEGFRIGLPAYIIPIMVVYNPVLLSIFSEGIGFGLLSIVTALIGITALMCAVAGWMLHRLNVVQRIILVPAAFGSLHPGVLTDVIGVGLLLVVLGWQYAERRPRATERAD